LSHIRAVASLSGLRALRIRLPAGRIGLQTPRIGLQRLRIGLPTPRIALPGLRAGQGTPRIGLQGHRIGRPTHRTGRRTLRIRIPTPRVRLRALRTALGASRTGRFSPAGGRRGCQDGSTRTTSYTSARRVVKRELRAGCRTISGGAGLSMGRQDGQTVPRGTAFESSAAMAARGDWPSSGRRIVRPSSLILSERSESKNGRRRESDGQPAVRRAAGTADGPRLRRGARRVCPSYRSIPPPEIGLFDGIRGLERRDRGVGAAADGRIGGRPTADVRDDEIRGRRPTTVPAVGRSPQWVVCPRPPTDSAGEPEIGTHPSPLPSPRLPPSRFRPKTGAVGNKGAGGERRPSRKRSGRR